MFQVCWILWYISQKQKRIYPTINPKWAWFTALGLPHCTILESPKPNSSFRSNDLTIDVIDLPGAWSAMVHPHCELGYNDYQWLYPQQNGENMVSKFQILFNALEMAMESEEGNTYGGFLSHRDTQTIRPNYGNGIETAMVTWGSSWIFHFVKTQGYIIGIVMATFKKIGMWLMFTI